MGSLQRAKKLKTMKELKTRFNLIFKSPKGNLRVESICVSGLEEAKELAKEKQPKCWKLVKIKEMSDGEEE